MNWNPNQPNPFASGQPQVSGVINTLPQTQPLQTAPAYPMTTAPMGQQPRGFVQRNFNASAVANAVAEGSRYPFLLDGDYVLEIQKTVVTTRKGAFVAEFVIVESHDVINGGPLVQRPPGFAACWVQGTDGNKADVALGAIKRFTLSGLGVNDDAGAAALGVDLTAFLNAMAEPDMQVPGNPYPANPLKGRKIRASVRTIATKQGRPFTRHDFAPFEG